MSFVSSTSRAAVIVAMVNLAMVTMGATHCDASIMTFNGNVADGGFLNLFGSYSESGYTVNANSGSVFLLDDDYNNESPLKVWDDDFLYFDSRNASVTITEDGGGTFDFLSAYVGSRNRTATVVFTGNYASGGSVTRTISKTLSGGFSTSRDFETFQDFMGLSSLEIRSTTPSPRGPILEDLRFEAVSDGAGAVPEPGSFAIWGGLVSLGALVGYRKYRS